MSEESKPIEVQYSDWVLDPASGMLVATITRLDTGEVIGRAERVPDPEPEAE